MVREVLDREPYYELYNKLTAEVGSLKLKNTFLQKKMADYFKKRKVKSMLCTASPFQRIFSLDGARTEGNGPAR